MTDSVPDVPETETSPLDSARRKPLDVARGGLDEARGKPAARALWTIAVCAVVALLYFGRPVLLPFVLSVLLFYGLDPLVTRLQRMHVPRALASIIVMIGLMVSLGAGVLASWSQLEQVIEQIPQAASQLRATIREARSGASPTSALEKVRAAATAIDRAAAESTEPGAVPRGTLRVEVAERWRVSDLLWTGSLGIIGFIGQVMTVMFLTTFMLIETDNFKRKLVRSMETLGSKRLTIEVLNDISQQIHRFIWVQVGTSAIVAIVTGATLWWLGLRQAAVWGIFAGVMNLVPYVGPLLVSVALSAVAFLQFETIEMALLVGGIALVVTTLEGQLLTPHLLSRAGSLNHVAVFVSIAFWSWLWGIAGMLLAVPILMVAKTMCDKLDGLNGIGEFLAE